MPGIACLLVGVGLVPTLAAPSPARADNSLYATDLTQGAVSTFSIGAAGLLSQQGIGMTNPGSQPTGVAVSADGADLYVANENQGTVSTYSIGAGGALTLVGSPVGSGNSSSSKPYGVAVSPAGQNVYVANYQSSTVSTFKVGAGGALTQQGTGVATGSTGPGWLAVSPTGQNLYVANYTGGKVSTFSIGAGGALTLLGSPVSTGTGNGSEPESVAISPNGDDLYVADHADGTVAVFSVGAAGALTMLGQPVPSGTTAGSGPEGLAISPNGQNLYVTNATEGTVSTFAIGAGGALTPRGTTTPISGTTTSSRPFGAAVAPGGQDLYVADFALGALSTFAIGAGGALTPQGAPVPSGSSAASGPYALVVSPDRGPSAAYSATVSPTQPASTFSAGASTPGSAPIAAYIWQFGDGAMATGAQVSHVFAAPGSYKVTLTLVGADSCSAYGPFTGQSPYCAYDPAATVAQTIAVPAPPIASHASITGVAKRRPKLAFTVAAGTLAPSLRTIAVKLPRGLSFSKRGRYLARHITVTWPNGTRAKFAAKLRRRRLIITLAGAQASAQVTIASPALQASARLANAVKRGRHHRRVRLTFALTLTDAGRHAVSLHIWSAAR